MADFKTRVIRELDQGGYVSAVGVEWTEPNWGWFWVCMTGVVVGVFMMMGSAFSRGPALQSGIFWLGLILMLAMYAAIAMQQSWRTVAVIFERNGRIATPHGYTDCRSHREIDVHFADITSIEWEQVGPIKWRIVMYSSGGDTVPLGITMTRVNAHKLAVQLNLALRDIRQASGEYARTGTRTADR